MFFSPRRSKAVISEKDSILLADFVNTTADPVFDGTLKKALAVDLEQSPYVNVFRSSEFGRRCNLWDAALKIALPVMWAARFACAMASGRCSMARSAIWEANMSSLWKR